MKKMYLFLLVVVASCFCLIESCSKAVSGDTSSNDSITVTLNKSQIAADGFEEVVITVKDARNYDITSSSTIVINNQNFHGNVFYTATPGTYIIKAFRGTIVSSEVNLIATTPGPSSFTQKLLAEDYTGTWCGDCPRVGIQLENYTPSHPNCIVVCVHNNDPIQFYSGTITGEFIQGYPSVAVNRRFRWNENNIQLDSEIIRRAPLELAFESTVNGSIINIKTKIKFDVTTSAPLKLVVMLVENHLIYSQVNFGYYGLPNPIPNYVHNNVLRAVATDLYGDPIPSSQQVKGNIWINNFSFNATPYNISNCRIVAFVIFGTNLPDRKGVLNVQSVAAGQNKDFD